MADEQTVEQKAQAMGWVPKEQFRGAEEKWIDAETYVERGETIMPILKKNNERLQSELSSLGGTVQSLQQALKESRDAITELVARQDADTEKAVKEAKAGLRAQLRQAKLDGNIDAQLEIEDRLEEMAEEQRAVPKAAPAASPAAAPPPSAPVNDPALVEWRNANPWFGQDRKKTALMVATAEEMRRDPANASLVGRAFYDAVQASVEEYITPTQRAGGKTEMGNSGGPGGGSGSGRGKSFADLPADAKAACARQGSRLIGKGPFKTEKDWQKHYAEQYFAQGE